VLFLNNAREINNYVLSPVLYSIGLNNILLNITDIKCFILPDMAAVARDLLKNTYPLDVRYEISTKFSIGKIDFLIRDKTDDTRHETNRVIADFAYHSKRNREVITISAEQEDSFPTKHQRTEGVDLSQLEKILVESASDPESSKGNNEELYITIQKEDGSTQPFIIDTNTTIKDILDTLIGPNHDGYGIFELKNIKGKPTHVRHVINKKVISINLPSEASLYLLRK